MTLLSHWTSVKFLRKIDLGLIWNHCWVFSVQGCEHWDQFLRISSKMISVLDLGISGPRHWPLRMPSTKGSPASPIMLLRADCSQQDALRWPREGTCLLKRLPPPPPPTPFFHQLIYGDRALLSLLALQAIVPFKMTWISEKSYFLKKFLQIWSQDSLSLCWHLSGNFLPVNPQRNGNKIEKGHFFLFFGHTTRGMWNFLNQGWNPYPFSGSAES